VTVPSQAPTTSAPGCPGLQATELAGEEPREEGGSTAVGLIRTAAAECSVLLPPGAAPAPGCCCAWSEPGVGMHSTWTLPSPRTAASTPEQAMLLLLLSLLVLFASTSSGSGHHCRSQVRSP
jgi:hypothetical protein